MKKPTASLDRPKPSPESRFRPQIMSAIASGVAPEAMTLRLTWRDAHLIARDPCVAVEEIRYDHGDMYFLRVRVQKGGVEASLLDLGATP